MFVTPPLAVPTLLHIQKACAKEANTTLRCMHMDVQESDVQRLVTCMPRGTPPIENAQALAGGAKSV